MTAVRTRAGKLLRVSGWIVGGVIGLAVVAWLVLLAINWRDQPPSQTAQSFAAAYRNRPPADDADNAFVYAMGFGVGPEVDPRDTGVRRIAWLHRAIKEPYFTLRGNPVEPYDCATDCTPAIDSLLETCQLATPECIAALTDADPLVTDWFVRQRWLFDRYRNLLAHRRWLETAPPDVRMTLPDYSGISKSQKFLLLRAWTLAGEQDAAAVGELLAQDVRFWRMALDESDLLLPKMLAVAMLTRHFSLGNIVLRRLPPELAASAVPVEWTVGLTDSERSMRRPLIGEWVFIDHVLEGERRAALVATELRARGVDAADVPAQLAVNPLKDPYTGKPLEWDASQRAIVFNGLGPTDRARHAFKY